MSNITEFVIFYQQDTDKFGARRATEILPSGSAPCAVVRDGELVWKAGYTSVSFPSGRQVGRAVGKFMLEADESAPQAWLMDNISEEEIDAEFASTVKRRLAAIAR